MTRNEQLDKLKIENLQLELDIKKIELLSKQKELDHIKLPKNRITLERATIFVAIIGFIGSFLGNTIQGFFSLRQKEQEFESALITNAVEAGDSSLSRRNLKFLLDAGLITDRKGKIATIIKDSTYVLPELNSTKQFFINDYVFTTPNGSKYHLPNCRIITNVTERVTIDKAKELKLQPCKICDPPDIYDLENQLVQCKAFTKSGVRCKHMTRISNGYCFQHQLE